MVVDVLEDDNCYILHHKVIVIDERTVITGSYNFTSSAERDNDENLVIVDDEALAGVSRRGGCSPRAFPDGFCPPQERGSESAGAHPLAAAVRRRRQPRSRVR
jgi:phosphatidylserine/phosphatidylglycerophosphate/cardiolipin synthase-like enzyme